MSVQTVAPVNVIITTESKGHSFITRFLWFLGVGWWLSAIFMTLGLIGIASIIFAPIGFWFINRVPKAQTLRHRSSGWATEERDGITHITERRAKQYPWIIRLLYLPVGLALGAIWLTIAWFVAWGIITMPISIWMVDRAPAVITLEKN